MEKRTTRTRVVRVNQRKKTTALTNFWRRHPYAYSVVATLAVFAVVSIAVTLIQNATNNKNIGPPPIPPVPGPHGISHHSKPTPQTPTPTRAIQPYAPGNCLAGNFEGETPTGVHKVSCSSDGAYDVLASFPGESESVCQGVKGAQLAYIQEELQDGEVVWSYVQCLGRP